MDDWQFNGLDDLEKIGDKVQDIIEKAIDSQNYPKNAKQNFTHIIFS